MAPDVDDGDLRYRIYRWFADTGGAPRAGQLSEWMGGAAVAASALRRLHDAHALVVDDDGRIRMALPFSAVDTAYRVEQGGRRWVANCAWDSLAIPAALGIDAEIDAPWLDDGSPVGLAVADGELTNDEGYIHFTVPARRWWDDIVET